MMEAGIYPVIDNEFYGVAKPPNPRPSPKPQESKHTQWWEGYVPVPAVLIIVGMMAICIICLGLVALNDGQNTTDDGIIMSETSVEEVISQGGPKASATTVGEWDRFEYDGQKEFGK